MHNIQLRLIDDCCIVIGEIEITPSAPHIFALLLALTLAPRHRWTRRGLQDLLFGDTDKRMASHRLRQLLYRLRMLGVVLNELPSGLLNVSNPVRDPLGLTAHAANLIDHRVTISQTGILAHYLPSMPAPYLDWLEQRRDALQRELTTRYMSHLRAARERQDWAETSRLACALAHLETDSEELVVVAAEAHAMLGRRDAAIETIDHFLANTEEHIDARPKLKQLRARILTTRLTRREGTLRGRETCLTFLVDQWRQTRAGSGGRACALMGAPGMGKSRIGETFSATARLNGGQVIQHRCDRQSRYFPLALFSKLVPDLRTRRGSIGADPKLNRVLEHIAPNRAVLPQDFAVSDDRRDELKRAIIDLLEAVSSEQPMLIVIDDAHLLDDASRAVVRSLVDSANSAQVLILLLCRPRSDGHSLLSPSQRFSSYVLTPLSTADSRTLLLELAGHIELSESQLKWAVSQAGGNAFYLNALAQHPSAQLPLPDLVRSLAQTCYLSLSPDARTVLDTCLLLDTLASPARVSQVSVVEDKVVLNAVRELEDLDLLRYEEGLFVGPHAIVRDVLHALMSTTVRAILHQRIALLLSEECASPSQARIVAWTAVRCWLEAGNPVAAVGLALQVARHAALVGEPEAGAVLLGQLPREALDAPTQREVLDEIISLADAGKCPSLLTQTLKERTALAVRSQEGAHAVASLTIKSIACHLLWGQCVDVVTLTQILSNPQVDPILRADATARVLTIADLHFDKTLAKDAFDHLQKHTTLDLRMNPYFLRANLIYHTTFGDRAVALKLIHILLAVFPELSLNEENRRSRANAAFGFLRLGYFEKAAYLAQASWEYMSSHSHLFAAEYFGSLAAEAYINLGDVDTASRIFTELERTLQCRRSSESTHSSGFCAVAVALAMRVSNYKEAERLIAEAIATHGGLIAPRLRSAIVAQIVRVRQLRGDVDKSLVDIKELVSLFARGSHLGAHDSIAEVLWHARVADDDKAGASRLLQSYLIGRRESGAPEAALRVGTSCDRVWTSYRPRLIFHERNRLSSTAARRAL